MLKIRRSLGRLIFNMGIAIPGKTVFLIETAPCISPPQMGYVVFMASISYKYGCVIMNYLNTSLLSMFPLWKKYYLKPGAKLVPLLPHLETYKDLTSFDTFTFNLISVLGYQFSFRRIKPVILECGNANTNKVQINETTWGLMMTWGKFDTKASASYWGSRLV